MSTLPNRLGAALAARLAALRVVRLDGLLLLALGSGAFAVLGFAPFAFFPAGPLAAAGLAAALSRGSPRAGLWRGFAFGIGLLGVGVSWVRISLNEFGNMDAWVANLAMGLFVAVLALFYGLLGWLVRRLDAGERPWAVPLLLLPGLYVLLEWLRGWLFTGFPWLYLGYTQIEGPLAGFAPVAGVYGVSLLTVLSGGLLWLLVRPLTQRRTAGPSGSRPDAGRRLPALALVALWAAGAGLGLVDWTRPAGEPFAATVVQANIPQSLKWEAGALERNLESHLSLTRDHLDSDLIVWPETAVPAFLHEVQERYLDPLAERARAAGTEVVLGIPVMDREGRYYNGLLAMGSGEDLYAKRHLVPFGEYMPLKDWVGPIARLFEVPMSDFSPGGNVRPLLQVGPRLAGASICYEDAFPAEVAQALPEAQFLINVSNDAWFGDSLAPHQHLEIARMRALETGRWLVRATNTGISAIVDHRGRVRGSLPSFVRGAYTEQVQPRAGATPFVAVGNRLALGLAAGLAVLGLLLAWKPRL